MNGNSALCFVKVGGSKTPSYLHVRLPLALEKNLFDYCLSVLVSVTLFVCTFVGSSDDFVVLWTKVVQIKIKRT